MSWGLRGAPGGYLGSPGGPFWRLGGLRGDPRRVIGAPWEAPGELRGDPWETPVGSLGRPWAVLGAIGANSRRKSGQGQSDSRFWIQKRCQKGAPRDPFWDPKPTQKRIQMCMRFWLRFSEFLGTLRGEKAAFSMECCSKSKVDLFAPRRPRG